jgi:hypothetical protein
MKVISVSSAAIAALAFAGLADAQPPKITGLAALRGICSDISTQTPYNEQPELISYMYEKRIYDAAGVDFAKDTPEQARKKIRKLWLQHQPSLRCQANNFNVRDGNILKYAIATRAYNLIDDAVKIWGIDVNIVDPSDNRTLLDYAESQRDQYKGTAMETELQNYIDILVRHGAKRRREL